MKTVVLVSGQMRTADKCAADILRGFCDAEFIVHAVADDDAHKGHLFKPRVLVIEPQQEMPERREYSIQIGRGCHGVQRVLKQLWGLKRVWETFVASGIKADVIVRMRPDIHFRSKTNEIVNVSEPFVAVPAFANWWGCNDRYAYGTRPEMERYFTRLDRLDEYIDRGGVFHPESFLAADLLAAGITIKKTKAVFATLRPDGTTDEPIWCPGAGDEY